LASSASSLPLLAGLEQLLQGSDLLSKFLKAVMTKYLVFHEYGDYAMGNAHSSLEQCKHTILDSLVRYEIAELEWMNGNTKEALKLLSDHSELPSLSIVKEKGESPVPVPSFLKKERDQRDMVSSICTNDDVVVDIEQEIKCKNAMVMLQ
jgi:proline dehydrogenase